MKPRRVVVLFEAETSVPIAALRHRLAWALALSALGDQGARVLQSQANVIKAEPMKKTKKSKPKRPCRK